MIDVRTSTSAAEDAVSGEIYNVVWPHFAFTSEEARAFKEAATAADDHLAFVDGVPVGSAFTAVRGERPGTVFALITVLPEHRRRGVGSALYATVAEWAVARDRNELEGFVEEADEPSVAFAARRGLRPVERFERLALALGSVAEPEAAAPDGVAVATWDGSEQVAQGMYEVALEAYRDEPGGAANEVEPFRDWLDHDIRRLEGRGATFVAFTGGEVIGYAQLSVPAARPGTAAHAYTGVRRAWRGRGVAGALKRAQITWAKERGFEQLVTQNEERNEPMLRLNRRLGYRSESVRLLVRGPVSGVG